MRLAPPGEEVVPKSAKDKKRRRDSPSDTPNPKKSKAHKSKNDSVALSAAVDQKLQDEEEVREDVGRELVARKRGNVEASKAAESMMVEEAHPQTEKISEGGLSKVPESSGVEDISCHDKQPASVPEGFGPEVHQKGESAPSDLLGEINIDDSPPDPTQGQFREARSMETPDVRTDQERGRHIPWLHRGGCDALSRSIHQIPRRAESILEVQQKAEKIEQLHEEVEIKEAETLGWKKNMDRLASENDIARAQLSSVERQLQIIREEILARAKKIKELGTRLAAELAKAASVAEKAKADTEPAVAVYRADDEAANTRAKEIFDAAQVRLSRAAEHTKCQSQRETLEEVHACGFDLTDNIENAKVLEAKAEAFLSDDDDVGSVSGSNSGEDEDEAPWED
ncbi:uncharacterized protein [Nicotiana sylvestris]|uniref:uncharacterized protein n=1 Tax=Nicotiana sylvestris TaxID=4096 RepID=UPI00388CD036